MEPGDVKRLRQLEQENARLKTMVTDRDLKIDVLKEITRTKIVGARMRRQQLAYAEGRGPSRPSARAMVSIARSIAG